jgi:two-component sensor histidine kinase
MNKTAIGAWMWGLIFTIILQAEAQPKPQILSVTSKAGKKSISISKIVKLDALDDDLVIKWKPCNCTYRYRLEGLETDTVIWNYPVARYTNLEGGDYTFWVQAQQNGVWSKPTQIVFQVEKIITEEWWFWPVVAIYVLLLVGAAIYFFLLYNFRQKLKVEHLRNRIASDLHDEVGATLSSIAIAARVVEKRLDNQSPDLQLILDQIKSDSNDTIQTIHDTVWTLNPHNDSLPQLIEKMRSFAAQILTAKDVVLQFENHLEETSSAKISMDQRQNVYLIFKEAINNIAKHAEATKVSVELGVEKGELRMRITDNGRGFDSTRTHEGNGLKNFKKRAEASFIDLKISSEIGKGTQITLVVPEM